MAQGISVGSRQFVALNTLGHSQLSWCCAWGFKQYCSPEAVSLFLRRMCGPDWEREPSNFLTAATGSKRIADEPPGQLYIEEHGPNIASNSWKWKEAVCLFQVRARTYLSARLAWAVDVELFVCFVCA